MEIYNNEYYKTNKQYLMFYGAWPYEIYRKKIVLRTCVTLFILIILIPQVIRLHNFFGVDLDIVIDHGVKILYVCGVYLKFLSTVLSEKKLKVVYENVAKNWKVIKDDCERKIMIEFSRQGKLLSRLYLVATNGTIIIFCTFPLTPPLLNMINPLNESRPSIYVFDGEYFVDKNKNFINIYIFESLFCLWSSNLVIAIDTMYVTNIQHCVGLFAIIKFRLRQPIKDITKRSATHEKMDKEDVSSTHIIRTIKLHKKVITFIEILELSYSSSFLLLMGMNMFIISLCSVLVIVQLHQVMQCIRYIVILVALIGHLFYISLPGQTLITYSTDLQEDAFLSDWYKFSIKAQKLLGFMMLRCWKPCKLTAGGLYVMNFPNFASIIKTSLSYVTLLASLR